MRIGITLATGLLLIAIAMVVTLSRAPLTVARTNLPLTHTALVTTSKPASACQTREVLPANTSAIRIGLTTDVGPVVTVQVLSGRRLVTQGMQAAGWEGASVTVPVRPVARTFAPVRVCFQLRLINDKVEMLGVRSGSGIAARAEGKVLPGRMHIEYLRPSGKSWWSMATSTARRLGLGRAAAGTWYALLALVLAGTVTAACSWLVLRELR